jgi:uncharacterized caspase-like protein
MNDKRKAVVVGINYYEHSPALHGCVNDAHSVKRVLERNSDGTKNFDVRLLSGTGPSEPVLRSELRDGIVDLFSGKCVTALFYFYGHGHIETTGGYLVASDAKTGNDGIPLSEVITLADESRAQNRVIILDSCHSGILGEKKTFGSPAAEIKEGTTILTASTADQYA